MVESELVRQFVRNRDVLMGFVFALTRDHDLAEDLFQDIAVAILTEAEKGTRPANFLSWARGLARHRVADHFRRQARSRRDEQAFGELADAVQQAFDESDLAAEESRDRLSLLRQCLGGLAERARGIVELRYRDRRAMADIASAVGWKESSVKVALAKARKALADCVRSRLRATDRGAP